MRFRPAYLVFLTMMVVEPATAYAFLARNRQIVNPIGNDQFEVVVRNGPMSGPYFWCAAGDYARRALKIDWQTPIYVARGLGPSLTTDRRFAVHFTTNPAMVGPADARDANGPSDLVTGFERSVTEAFGKCDDQSVSQN
jgi:hypothetical protein